MIIISALVLGFIILVLIPLNIAYNKFLNSLTPEELAAYKEEEAYEMQLW